MNIPKKLAFSFQAILNRFFSIIQTDNPPKVINFAIYEQEVNTEQKYACFQGLTSFLPVDKQQKEETNNFTGKKNRIYLSTVLTAYYHYHRDLKKEREIKFLLWIIL